MKRRFASILAVLIILTVVLVGCSNVTFSSAVNYSSVETPTSWTITASSINSQESRTVSMSAENLNALAVASSNSEGSISLVITQGDITRTVDISGQFSGRIGAKDFSPGRIEMDLHFEHAKDARVNISW